jgi:5-hydroxyisourate hydrolase-like protein (transthyretin family)
MTYPLKSVTIGLLSNKRTRTTQTFLTRVATRVKIQDGGICHEHIPLIISSWEI